VFVKNRGQLRHTRRGEPWGTYVCATRADGRSAHDWDETGGKDSLKGPVVRSVRLGGIVCRGGVIDSSLEDGCGME